MQAPKPGDWQRFPVPQPATLTGDIHAGKSDEVQSNEASRVCKIGTHPDANAGVPLRVTAQMSSTAGSATPVVLDNPAVAAWHAPAFRNDP